MKKKNLIIGLLSIAMLASCTGTPSASQPNESENASQAVNDDVFEITTDLEEEKEIHTDAQKEYLKYNGDYETIDPNLYPDGKGPLTDSDPKPVKLEWDYEPSDEDELSYYSVTLGQDRELTDGYVFKGTKSKSINVQNVFLGTNYFKVTANYKDGSAEESKIYDFKVDEAAPRNVAIGGMTNCRDMGGRNLVSGGKIKQGLIYRTSGVTGNYPAQVTSDGLKTLKEQLKVKTEINVSDGSQYNGGGNGWNVVDCFMNYNQGQESTWHHFSRNAESVKKVFELLADEDNYPVFYHCRIGTDRTGLTAILINGLLGVDRNEILQDYLFSNFGNIQEKRYIGEKAGQDNIQNYLNEIAEMPGANWAEKTYNALLAIGVPAATLNKVIEFLTDGDNVIEMNAKGQKIGMGEDLTGATMKTSNDRNNPAKYFTLSANSSVSYKVTLTESYNAYLTGYLGIASASQTNKLASAIKVEVDGEETTVADKNYYKCGFGNLNGRTCYYFNKIGEKQLAAGEHTIKLTAKVANVNVGAIGVFKK